MKSSTTTDAIISTSSSRKAAADARHAAQRRQPFAGRGKRQRADGISNEDASQRGRQSGPGSRASGNRLQMPAKKEHRRIGARVFAPTVIHARLAFVYRP